MTRSTKIFVLFAVVVAAHVAIVNVLLLPQWTFAQAASSQAMADARTACAADVQRLCAGVPEGGGRIIACLKQHQDQVSDRCKQAIGIAMQRPAGNTGSGTATPTAPPPPAQHHDTSPKIAAPPNPVPSPVSHSSAPAGGNSGPRYYLMKQVQLIDQHADWGKPAYHLMIPTAWQFKGWVNSMVSEGGCFADFFSVFGDAKSADNSIELQMLPKYTWQYMDDPAGQRQMQVQNQRDAKVGLKPCPVRAPVPAAEFLRQDLIAKYRKGKTVVSVDPFPELDQIVRYQMGLPPAGAGGNTGGIRVDAARARLAFNDDKGQPVEEWIAAAIVVRPIQTGRGTGYDWHAVNALFFRAPKGQLDSNDRLFKLIATTIHPDPAWQKWSNGIIANLYQRKQEELAKQAAIVAQLQQNVINTLQGVTARAQAGSMQSAYGASQVIREVQTFRDPSTGATFELSNKYDNAWLDPGSNQYVMSDDPNFNPRGNVSGNWTQLQVVHPQP